MRTPNSLQQLIEKLTPILNEEILDELDKHADVWATTIECLDAKFCYRCEIAHRVEHMRQIFDGSEWYCEDCADLEMQEAASEENLRSSLNQLER